MPADNSHALVVALTVLLATAASVRADLTGIVPMVWGKDQHYAPTDLSLHTGDTLRLINGDESAVHHAFIEADRFTFDAGDQEPGAEARLTLTEPGDFIVQCGIHPKMKLTLHVR